MSDKTLIVPVQEEPIVEYETIRYRDLDLRKPAKALAKKEDARQRKLYDTSKQNAIKSARKRIADLEKEVEKLGQSKAELLGYVGEIANLQSWLKRIQDEKEEVSSERDFILMSLLNQKNHQEVENKKIPEAKRITTSMVTENIWFVRSLLCGVVFLASATLLVYSLYFKQVFDSIGRVVSYFPWSWGTFLTSSASVNELYALGVGVSFLLIGFCLVGLVYFVPELVKSLVKESLSDFPEALPKVES